MEQDGVGLASLRGPLSSKRWSLGSKSSKDAEKAGLLFLSADPLTPLTTHPCHLQPKKQMLRSKIPAMVRTGLLRRA